VDVGAGTRHACGAELARYLAPRRDRVVLVMDDPEAAFGRNVTAGHRGPNDSRDYLEVEFRQREALYSLAEHVVDYRKVGMDGALPQLLHIVGELLH
jgi:hypothetical protein